MEIVQVSQESFKEHFTDLIRLVAEYKDKITMGRTAKELLYAFQLGAENGLSLFVFEDDLLIGFAIIVPRVFDDKKALDVIATYISTQGDGYRKGWEAIKLMAQEKEADIIMCETMVGDRWDAYYKRKLKPCGFKPVLTTYIAEV